MMVLWTRELDPRHLRCCYDSAARLAWLALASPEVRKVQDSWTSEGVVGHWAPPPVMEGLVGIAPGKWDAERET